MRSNEPKSVVDDDAKSAEEKKRTTIAQPPAPSGRTNATIGVTLIVLGISIGYAIPRPAPTLSTPSPPLRHAEPSEPRPFLPHSAAEPELIGLLNQRAKNLFDFPSQVQEALEHAIGEIENGNALNALQVFSGIFRETEGRCADAANNAGYVAMLVARNHFETGHMGKARQAARYADAQLWNAIQLDPWVRTPRENARELRSLLLALGMLAGGEDGEEVPQAIEKYGHPSTSRTSSSDSFFLECNDDAIRVRASAFETGSNFLGIDEFDKAFTALASCGVSIVENAVPDDLVVEMATSASAAFELFLERRQVDPSIENSTTNGKRSEGRWEIKLPHTRAPFNDTRLLLNPIVHGLTSSLIYQKVQLDTFSFVGSLAHTPKQHWHRDVDDLVLGFGKEKIRQQLPPHGVVMFVPLRDVDERTGTTEFLLKSHLRCPANERIEVKDAEGHAQTTCRGGRTLHATAKRGSAILFDSRVLHRGGSNQSPKERLMLYAAFNPHWFVDTVNFDNLIDAKRDDDDVLSDHTSFLAQHFLRRINDAASDLFPMSS